MEEFTYFPGEQPTSKEEEDAADCQEVINEQYTTNISELISEPASDSMAFTAAHYIFSSLYQLSSYLFFKKIKQQNEEDEQNSGRFQMSFNSYLEQMSEELGRLGKNRSARQRQMKREAFSMESQLIRCYQQVEHIYFEQKYFLDFSYFQLFYSELRSPNLLERNKVNQQLDKLIEALDLVEVNLFSQIHCKFHEYFAAAANFQYLHESVVAQLKKLSSSRAGVQKVKVAFVDKSVKLRKMIVQRQNIEKVMRLIKTIKSIKKLPQVMESILASSLPYECLQLLEQTKNTLESVKNLKFLTNTADSVRQMEVLAQNDLSKRYASELYLYLQECHSKEFINLGDIWKKIEVRFCLDKDSSLVIDELNSSSNSGLSQNPHMLDELQLMDHVNNDQMNKKTLLQRHEGRQYQIAMILLQSYKYVNFSPEVTKIKVCNALRMFSKRFQRELMAYLNEVVTTQILARNQEKNSQAVSDIKVPQDVHKKNSDDQENESTEVVQKVSVQFYVKHVGVFNQIFKQTISRFLGYLQTLVTEYEQDLNSNRGKQTERNKLQANHIRFKSIFAEQCSLLPSIFKIIEQKLKYLLTLKNISSITSFQFYQWISTLKYWQRYFDYLMESHPLLNHRCSGETTANNKIEQLIDIMVENVRRAVSAMALKTLLSDLTMDYIKVYHKNTLNNEIINTLQEDTWQSTQIPPQFSDILSSILNPDGHILNSSITILDSSSTKSNTSREMSKNDLSREQGSKARSKFKLLKNNIMVSGIRYKVNLSFLVLCEVIDQYLKMSRILANVLTRQDVEETGYNKIVAFIYEKIFDLIEQFSNNGRQLILETKALKFEKIKGKSINAKHICLLCNCLSVVLKISDELADQTKIDTYSLGPAKASLTANLQGTVNQLISKLALILNSKIEKQINDYMNAEKQNANLANITTKTNNTIITALIQMVEISDEYLDIQNIKKVLKPAFQTLSQRYLTHLLQKGGRFKAQVQLLSQKMKFMKKYFVNEYEALLKDIPN